MPGKIYTAPPNSGIAVRGKTLPQILYEAAERYDNPAALNQPHQDTWKPYSLADFKRHAEEIAFGLAEVGIARGDRIAMYMESDAHFCIFDMGCLIAGVVDVPIYLTHGPEQIRYVIQHSGARTIAVSNATLLEAISDSLDSSPTVRTIIVAEIEPGADLSSIARGRDVISMDVLRDRGRQHIRSNGQTAEALHREVSPDDLATIIYTSGTTGTPKGVMLSHENISYNALTSFSGLPDYVPGPKGEVTVSFLPLTHVFARTLYYGFVYHGTSVYFTSPEKLADTFVRVRPTVFATVPRVLEKVYGQILERVTRLGGIQKRIANWSLDLAENYEIGSSPSGLYAAKLALADRLVFSKWRRAFGGRVKYVISGGAALSPRLTNMFAAAGVTVLQGYGLTETSPVITFNRPGRNRSATVGEPIPGVEVKIADDGEILTRGPHIMLGYYGDEESTSEAIDDEGWFHTGDIGEISADGYLRITDRKKDLFKLSTGKYVMPQPLESHLTTHPLIEQAVVVGSGYKFATALLFPDEDKVRVLAESRGLDARRPIEDLLAEPIVQKRFRELVTEANRGMDSWSRIKRFRIVPERLTPENGRLTPTLKVRRGRIQDEFGDLIESMYSEEEMPEGVVVVEQPEQHQHA